MIEKLLVLFFLNIGMLNGLSINMATSGCSAYDCKRSCIAPDISATPGDNGFKFEIDGLSDDKYKPDSVYKGQLHFIFYHNLTIFGMRTKIKSYD